MRLVLALFLLVTPVLAEEATIASRFPAGAAAYVEARGVAKKIDAALQSPLGQAIKNHPALKEAMQTPQARQLLFGQAMLQGATGLDGLGVVRALGSKELAVAVYAENKFVAIARVDPQVAQNLLGGAEIMTQKKRVELIPADETGPALWQLGPAFVVLDGDLLVAGTHKELVEPIRSRTAEGLDPVLGAARDHIGARTDIFGFINLNVFGEKLRKAEKPENIGAAFLLGAFAHQVKEAPWAAFGVDLDVNNETVAVRARGLVPVEKELPAAVHESFCGTLNELPLALPERTLAVVRLRRSLPALWTHRDALVAERGIPGTVEFETNFGNLTGGMSWVEGFLPALRESDMVLLATRRVYKEGEESPAIRYPQGAVLFPIKKESDQFAVRMQIAFQTGIGIINAQQQGGMGGTALLMANENYKGTYIQTARFLPPSEGEMDGRKALPPRYNFEPSAAVVGDHFVIASTTGIVKEIIDAQGGKAPVRSSVNSGIWLRPAEILASLKENREPLVAQMMVKNGDDRATAEKKLDLGLDFGRYVRSLAITAEESRASMGVALELILGTAKE